MLIVPYMNDECVRTCMQSLISEEHYASSEIESRLRNLEEEHTKLRDTWKKRQSLFSQCHELQVFLRDAEQRDGWIGTQEAFLANEDLGVRIIIMLFGHNSLLLFTDSFASFIVVVH